MNPIRVFAAAALMSAFVATSGVDAAAQTVNDLFNRQTIKEIRLFIHSKDRDTSRTSTTSPIFNGEGCACAMLPSG
jgi:hypothetical protein